MTLTERLGEAIQALIHEDDDPDNNMAGGVVTKWIAAVEVALPDGDRILFTAASEGLKTWETLGMLETMAARERQSAVESFFEDGDEQ